MTDLQNLTQREREKERESRERAEREREKESREDLQNLTRKRKRQEAMALKRAEKEKKERRTRLSDMDFICLFAESVCALLHAVLLPVKQQSSDVSRKHHFRVSPLDSPEMKPCVCLNMSILVY